jgi:alginate O-acetyltransferase complex protein AlgI
MVLRQAPAGLLAIGVAVNLLNLGYFKYATFLWQLAQAGGHAARFGSLPSAPAISLPIGISFFTFQAISYLVDVYRKDVSAAGSYGEFGTYHSLFPQLVAGPIVRYREIKSEMQKRPIDRAILTEGAYRFCLGLGKKIVIADNVGRVADAAFTSQPLQLDAANAWLGVFCYALQIYFDFSGYSDMAIGLGRRWHMTLSRRFRDYLYIPLGGNRRGNVRTFVNSWVVFFLCGLWHGAGLTFIVWGLYHGLLLVIERFAATRFNGGRQASLASL